MKSCAGSNFSEKYGILKLSIQLNFYRNLSLTNQYIKEPNADINNP